MKFADFTKRVVQDYQEKMAVGKLNLELIEPSPARLRDFCLVVYNGRYESRDEEALENFFGRVDENKTRLKTIEDCDIDIFRPLINFLKKPTIKTDPKNVKLLAWLIDYQGRPYDLKLPDPPPKVIKGQATGAEDRGGKKGTTPVKSKENRFYRKKSIMLVLAAAVVGGVIWLIIIRSSAPRDCMFWAGDRYEPTLCGQMHGDTPVISLDSAKMARFRKITQQDTITENALGSIWYAKFRGVYECYTAPGAHPLDTSLKLRPLTDYVLLRHIHPGLR